MTTTFAIDVANQLGAHSILDVAPTLDRVAVTWLDQNGVGSFEIRVEELGDVVSIVDAEAVPGNVRQNTLGGLSLESGTQYRAVVLSHSHDVFMPGPLSGQFNMAFDLWTFAIGGSGPNVGGAQRRVDVRPVANSLR